MADTHIPDRALALHPDLIPALREARVERILHAGDISTFPVIDQLEKVAPVDWVRGNRDWVFRDNSGWVKFIHISGISVALMHGHISWFRYLYDKIFYISEGYRFARYQPHLLRASKDAQVIVFGHTHHAENAWVGGKLLFNPGSAGFGFGRSADPSWGVLTFFPDGRVEGQVYPLNGYRLMNGDWVKKSQLDS